jgi:hypothetical protein
MHLQPNFDWRGLYQCVSCTLGTRRVSELAALAKSAFCLLAAMSGAEQRSAVTDHGHPHATGLLQLSRRPSSVTAS